MTDNDFMASKTSQAATVRGFDLSFAFSENVAAKIIQVAQRGRQQPAPLTSYPHTVPQEGPSAGCYEEREAEFWTCGFFPGCIYALLERSMRFPHSLDVPSHIRPHFQRQLLALGRHYSVAIKNMSSRTDTHDMGFIVQPALQKDWELTGNQESLQAVTNAAYALASRYDPKIKAIRSWDVAINKRYSITNMNENFLVIIDGMCNLDLLYYAGHTLPDPTLIAIATAHAKSTTTHLLRPNHSTIHLANLSPDTGCPLAKLTNQGYADTSTWSRGQAWAILGFAQCYAWTKDTAFLATAMRCADHFLRRCEEGKGQWVCWRVPVWDFDAPTGGDGDDGVEEHKGKQQQQQQQQQAEKKTTRKSPPRDVSAGVIAANGLFTIYQALQSLPDAIAAHLSLSCFPPSGPCFFSLHSSTTTTTTTTPLPTQFLDTALAIISHVLEYAYDMHLASFSAPTAMATATTSPMPTPPTEKTITTSPSTHNTGDIDTIHVLCKSSFDAILRSSTSNWNEHAYKRYKDHGLVYADYYLLEFGNKLLRAGLL